MYTVYDWNPSRLEWQEVCRTKSYEYAAELGSLGLLVMGW